MQDDMLVLNQLGRLEGTISTIADRIAKGINFVLPTTTKSYFIVCVCVCVCEVNCDVMNVDETEIDVVRTQ